MLSEHLRFIDTASEQQLEDTRAKLDKLLPSLREPEVRRDTQHLLRAIDRELLDRVMRQSRLSGQAPTELPAAKAA